MRMVAQRVLALLLSLLFASAACAQQVPSADASQRIEAGAKAMQHWYLKKTGLYTSTGWWNSANAITALIDASRTTGSKKYRGVLKHTLKKAQIVVPKAQQVGELKEMTGAPGFLNKYYDDEGWWALAWIDAYDLTGDKRFLQMSESIFTDIAGGWDDVCGGGVWWSKDRKVKNAIENELFFSVAAHLANRVPGDAQYRDWADREWKWFAASGMINSDGLVNDGLDRDKETGVCRNNGKTTWTYNQGVMLGGLAEWSKATHDASFLTTAHRTADAAIAHLTDTQGILHEPCEPHCGGDGIQFKGIFVRNLSTLNTASPDPGYAAFFQKNAESIWTHDRTPQKHIRHRLVRPRLRRKRRNPGLRPRRTQRRGAEVETTTKTAYAAGDPFGMGTRRFARKAMRGTRTTGPPHGLCAVGTEDFPRSGRQPRRRFSLFASTSLWRLVLFCVGWRSGIARLRGPCPGRRVRWCGWSGSPRTGTGCRGAS